MFPCRWWYMFLRRMDECLCLLHPLTLCDIISTVPCCFWNLILVLSLGAGFVTVPHLLKHSHSLDTMTNPPTHCALIVISKPCIIHQLREVRDWTAFPLGFLRFSFQIPLSCLCSSIVNVPSSPSSPQLWREMESSDDDTLSERSCASEPSFRSERSGGSLSPCPSGLVGLPGDTLPWNLSKHERRKRKSQNSVLDPAERAVVRVAGKETSLF